MLHLWTLYEHSKDVLWVGFLQECTPELILLLWVDKDQAAVVGGQAVIDDDGLPFAVVPEVEAEHATVAFPRVEALVLGNDLPEEMFIEGKTGRRRQEPAITWTMSKVSKQHAQLSKCFNRQKVNHFTWKTCLVYYNNYNTIEKIMKTEVFLVHV